MATSFVPFTLTHGAAVLFIVLFSWLSLACDRCSPKVTRTLLSVLSLFFWFASWIGLGVASEWNPPSFLPLYLCNWLNLLGPLAVWTRKRWLQGLVFFWGCTMSPWALVVPDLVEGPGKIWFWIFFGYHALIFPFLFLVWRDGFRPAWRDTAVALAITTAYLTAVGVLNYATGWNYCFVGNSTPLHPSPIDALGPYPIRLLPMWLLGVGLFALTTVIAKFSTRGRRSTQGMDP